MLQQDLSPTLIAAPTVEAFDPAKLHACRACGLHITRWDRLRAWLKGNTAGIAVPRYCAGGKAPTESRGGMAAMMMGETEHLNPCAGITRPHLHCPCNRCGYSFLMATQTVCPTGI